MAIVMKYDRGRYIFLATVVLQALHSTEEYLFKFYNLFSPAHYLGEHFPQIVRPGFVTVNLLFIVFGLFCFWKYSNLPSSKIMALIWIWIIIEIFNGLGHATWGIIIKGYVPGLITGLLFLPLMPLLIIDLKKKSVNRGKSDKINLSTTD